MMNKMLNTNNSFMKIKSFSKFMLVVILMSFLVPTSYSQQGFSFSENEKQTKQANNFIVDEIISIGTASSPWGSYNTPADFYGKTSLSQTIYTKDEINHEPFAISQLQYTYTTVNPNITVNPIEGEEFRVWLCNTTETSLSEEAGWWIPYENFTLVFDGPLTLQAGTSQNMTFTLSSPYVYNGENLCIMIERKLSESSYENHFQFVASVTPDGTRGREYWSFDTPIDLENMISDPNYHGMSLDRIADIDIYVSDATAASLSGTVTAEATSEPIEGAEVKILGSDLVTYTDAQGEYAFPVLNEGNLSVRVSSFGYVSEEVELNIDGNITQDFALALLPNATVSGKVVDKDNNPLENANITITGYDNYSTTSDANGNFTVTDVLFADDYTIVTEKEFYITDTSTFNVSNENTVLNDIVLADFIRSPSLVQATANDNTCNVSWLSPYDIVDFRYDGGNCWDGISHINGEIAVIGNIFREPASLYKASWFRASSELTTSDSLNLFIFPLNEQQEPINNPIFVKKIYSPGNAWSEYVFEETLELENGFLVGLSGMPNDLSLGVDDGANAAYPFIPNVNYASENYLDGNGNFFPLEAAVSIPGNLMVRAEGYNTLTGKALKNTTARSINEYQVFRLVDGDQGNPSQWTSLDEHVSGEAYTDNEWGSLDNNWYRYAVKAVYSDNQVSDAAFSNVISKGLTTDVTVEVTTNTPNTGSQGAKVRLRNVDNYEYTYTGFIDNEDGTIVFSDIMKGFYNITIELDGYTAIYEQDVDFSTDDAYTIQYQLIEDLAKPSNLEVSIGEEVVLYWNVTETISDGFESYGDFGINPSGDIKWSYLDLDGNPTTTFSGIYFPHQGEPSAFTLFTPEATQPSIDLIQFPGMAPNSGDSYLMGFGYPNSTNNDFIISPKLNFSQSFAFSFFAKSFSLTDFPTFRVGYSTTGKNAEDFEWLSDPISPMGGNEYTLFNFNVPKEAKYVCINNISEDETILMLDDINIRKNRNATNYKVYLDGALQGETTDLHYALDIDTQVTATYQAAVEAVYETGTSEKATIEFTLYADVEDQKNQRVNIYPIPANNTIHIDGGLFDTYYIYDISGKLVKTNKLQNAEINISNFDNGVYTIKLINNDISVTRKIIVNH